MNNKALSPLVATMLLIAISVAASVVTYSWVMAMIGSQSNRELTEEIDEALLYHVLDAKTIVYERQGQIWKITVLTNDDVYLVFFYSGGVITNEE